MAAGASAFAWTVFCFAFAWLVPSSIGTPVQLLGRDTGSSTDPYCTYNENPNHSCYGQPVASYCEQAISAVCSMVSTFNPGNNTIVSQQVGYNNNNGTNADCTASVSAGTDTVLSEAECNQKFEELLGCYETTNSGYDANCVGGSINIQFNTGHSGQQVRNFLPSFALGTPDTVDSILDLNAGDRPTGVVVAPGSTPVVISPNQVSEMPAAVSTAALVNSTSGSGSTSGTTDIDHGFGNAHIAGGDVGEVPRKA